MKCPHCNKDIQDKDEARRERAKAAAEIERINKEYAAHNPIADTNKIPGGDPDKFDRARVIGAAPVGYFAMAYGVITGPFRDTIKEAEADVIDGAEWYEAGGVSAVAHAWRGIDV